MIANFTDIDLLELLPAFERFLMGFSLLFIAIRSRDLPRR